MRFEMSADGTEVLDHQTGLIWQRAIEENLTYKQALEHAERVAQATGQAWRVPTTAELVGLIDWTRASPASEFPDMTPLAFWSSSPYVGDSFSAWLVGFDDGYVSYDFRSDSSAVRLVRGG